MLLAVALTHLADPENATSAYEQAGKLYVLQVYLNINLKLHNQCTGKSLSEALILASTNP